MILNELEITNFKCFSESIHVPISKLTLITGANSSGKSSIIASILGAVQSDEYPFQFSINGKYINMGDFHEIVNNHDLDKIITIAHKFKSERFEKIETRWRVNESTSQPKLAGLSVTGSFGYIEIRQTKNGYNVDFEYDFEKDTHNTSTNREITSRIYDMMVNLNRAKKNTKRSKAFEKDLRRYFSEQSYSFKNKFVKSIRDINDNSVQNGFYKLYTILQFITKHFNSFDNQFNYISSFRLHPERTNLEQSRAKFKVDKYGDGYLDQIMYWEDRSDPKFNELVAYLKELDLLYALKTKRIQGGRYELSVKIKENGASTSLFDVGFGISQFLPIIVADLQLPRESTLIVAQPEIHLHPSVQAAFGDYIIRQVKSKSKGYIIETHSEYLLNRIRLGIVNGDLKKEELEVIFIDNVDGKSSLYNITFDEHGQIHDAPSNFFETYMMDVMEIAIQAAE